jgi:hypothetical protein
LRAAASISNSRVDASVSNSRSVASVSTLDSEYPAPYTWSAAAKDDEEYTWQESTVAGGDVIQANKGQETIERIGS